MEERWLIERIDNPNSARDFNYLALELIVNSYDASQLIGLSQGRDSGRKLGYLADISADGIKETDSQKYQWLKSLSDALYKKPSDWIFLEPLSKPGQKLLEESLSISPARPYNVKWKIYTTLGPADVMEWVPLYKQRHEPRPTI